MSGRLTPGGPLKLLTAVTTAADGAGRFLLLRGACETITIILQSTGTTSGGTLQIEEAYFDPDTTPGGYTGTWSAIGSAINASSFTGGAQLATHVSGSFWAIRVRVATDITGGGSVSAWAWGD